MASTEKPESVLDCFWKLAYARHSFEHARITCDHIVKTAIASGDDIYYPLMLAAHVTYARPFKRSGGGVRKLDEGIVPARFRDLHKEMIKIRDQALAHTDADGSKYRGLPGNHVRVKVQRDGGVNLVVQDLKARIHFIPQIRELCESLITKMTQELKLVSENKDFVSLVPRITGEYIVDLKEQRFAALSLE